MSLIEVKAFVDADIRRTRLVRARSQCLPSSMKNPKRLPRPLNCRVCIFRLHQAVLGVSSEGLATW